MKRAFALVLTLMMTISCCLGVASAAETVDTRASVTLSDYNAMIKAGSGSGDILIGYEVSANMIATEVGVSSIAIYKSGGTYVTTIYGGMSSYNDDFCKGTYTYSGTSGVSYYAKVTVFATSGSVSDSRTVTTSTVKAP